MGREGGWGGGGVGREGGAGARRGEALEQAQKATMEERVWCHFWSYPGLSRLNDVKRGRQGWKESGRRGRGTCTCAGFCPNCADRDNARALISPVLIPHTSPQS